MLYNRYNDNNHNTTSNTTIAIVFLEIFAFLSINATYGQKRGLCRLVEFDNKLI